MMKTLRMLLLLLLTSSQGLSYAEDRIQLDQTTVIDNHELPKVTYIVPWQAAQLPEREEPPLDTLIDHALAPLDRDVLRSRIQYYYAVTPPAQVSGKSSGKTAK
jgi:hypothetical protein